MGRVHIKAGDVQIERWHDAAHDARMSFSAWARQALDRALEAKLVVTGVEVAEAAGTEGGAPVGEVAAAPDPVPPPEPPAAEAHEEEPSPIAAPPPRRSIEDVLGAAHGTVSGPQSVKAIEAARRQQEMKDAFSITCPKRAEHTPGVRCPACKGIQ